MVVISYVTSLTALAQTAGSATTAGDDQAVVLDPFKVSGNNVGPYQVSEALSGGRIRAQLFDSTQNMSVLTNALMQDIGNNDLNNATVYFAGVSNNSSQTVTDRVSIRGFQIATPDVDGFVTPQTFTKIDTSIYDSIELVRGANAIISPSGSPGGTLNLISKTAEFRDFGTFTAEFGQYDSSDRGNFDVNHTVGTSIAYRIVASYIDSTQGDNQGYHQNLSLSPSVAWKIGSNSELLFHFSFIWGSAYTYLGLPVDPSVGTNTPFKLLAGVNPYETGYADNASDPSSRRHNNRVAYRTVFKTRFSDHFSMRLTARYLWDWETSNQWNLLGNTGGGYNPFTGFWVPGTIWATKAPFTASPAPATTAIYTLSQSPTNELDRYFDLQNDYVYEFKNAYLNSETVAGLGTEVYNQTIVGYSATSPAINIFNIPTTATWTVNSTPVTNQYVDGNFLQLYLTENLKLLSDHVVLNAGVAPTWYYQNVDNYLANLAYATSSHPAFKNYGVDILPVSWISLFYGHSENAAYIVVAPTAAAPTPPEEQSGKEDEEGIRVRFLHDRAVFTVTHYELYQNNNSVVNPLNGSNPPPPVTLPPLLENRVARGWEYELNMPVSKELSLIANYTNYRDRSPYGVPFRGESENSGAAFIHYAFDQGFLNGFAVGVGYTHQGKRAGDTVSTTTPASTPTNQIPQQPSFYLPAYGLLNLSASYRYNSHWLIRAYVDNALNTNYYAGAQSRNSVLPGIPINPRGSITYSF